MALTLNTNIDSLTAQNNLTVASVVVQSLTRLSSGLRINRPRTTRGSRDQSAVHDSGERHNRRSTTPTTRVRAQTPAAR